MAPPSISGTNRTGIVQSCTSGSPTCDSQRAVRGAGVGTGHPRRPQPRSRPRHFIGLDPDHRAAAGARDGRRPARVVRAAGPVPSSSSIAFVNAEGATTWAFSCTTISGTAVSRSTRSATEPSHQRDGPRRPWVPITIRSASGGGVQDGLGGGTAARPPSRTARSCAGARSRAGTPWPARGSPALRLRGRRSCAWVKYGGASSDSACSTRSARAGGLGQRASQRQGAGRRLAEIHRHENRSSWGLIVSPHASTGCAAGAGTTGAAWRWVR